MNSPEHDLSLRKEMLLARSALCRLKIRQETVGLRESFSRPGAVSALAAAPPARAVLFLLAAEVVGRARTARWLAIAAQVLAAVRLAGVALDLLRKPPGGPPPP